MVLGGGMKVCAMNTFSGFDKPEPHHSDHLVPFCELLDIPLIVTDMSHLQWIEDHYPGVRVQYEDADDLTIEYWMANYDLLFRTYVWDMHSVWKGAASLEEKYGRQLRTVHCPHGLSDKVYWYERMRHEDALLIYGDLMEEMIREQGIDRTITSYLKVGNPRWDYYQRHKAFFDKKVEEEVFSHFDQERTTILYAPTWYDSLKVSSFFKGIDWVVKALPEGVNLLVKLHPRLEDSEHLETYKIMAEYHDRGDIYFLADYPYVLPLLDRCELYIGDYSSIGYDFLAFNRPMVFLNQMEFSPGSDRRTLLFQCGIPLVPADYPNLSTVLSESLSSGQKQLSSARRVLWERSFAPTLGADPLWDYLGDLLKKGRPSF